MIEWNLLSAVSATYTADGSSESHGPLNQGTSGEADIGLARHRARLSAELLRALRVELLRLADREDERAATEASMVPYWTACPPQVSGHRAAATILRENAANLDDVA